MRETKRARLDRATKKAKRSNPRLTWKQARELAMHWCVAMWPDDFDASDDSVANRKAA
jgi:hypothetical protein